MANNNEQMSHKGGRYATRGWAKAAEFKARTNRKTRRESKKSVREGNEAPSYKERSGYTW
jgi:hypothetical protein